MDTDRLAVAIAGALEARFGTRPHLVVSRLHRRKLDPNRESEEAAEGHPLALQAWREYQGFVEHAKARVADVHGNGLFLDVHGHGHEIDRLELGYLLSSDDLAGSDDEIEALAGRSSVRTLAASSPHPFADLIRGEPSLGTLYESAGYAAVPGSTQPDPGNEPYFSGGYNTRRHGSRDGGPISAVQIEAPLPGVRDTPENRSAFASATARILESFMSEHDEGPGAAGTAPRSKSDPTRRNDGLD